MALVSMKTDGGNHGCCIEDNPYGYGLQIRLDENQCRALGITEPLRAGSIVTVSALSFVTEAAEYFKEGGEKTESKVMLCLQITDLELGSPSRSKDELAKTLYKDEA